MTYLEFLNEHGVTLLLGTVTTIKVLVCSMILYVIISMIFGSWPTSENSGWVMTSFGGFVHFSPKEDVDDSKGILGIWIIIVAVGGVTLMSLSALASSSTTISSWVTRKIGNEEEKKRDARNRRKKSKKQ